MLLGEQDMQTGLKMGMGQSLFEQGYKNTYPPLISCEQRGTWALIRSHLHVNGWLHYLHPIIG